MPYYLAVDIGASSGRHILGYLEDGRLKLQEVYRFENGMTEKNGHLCWDFETLFTHIKKGLAECARIDKIPVSMGIDTWGVDFVLLDQHDKVLGDTIGYRDSRTDGCDSLLGEKISSADLYRRTGIQKQIFNTIYQLEAVKRDHPEFLDQAQTFLMVPEYLNYLLTSVKMAEYTNGTTTQLVHAETKAWDFELMEQLGYPTNIFQPLNKPGTAVGHFTEAVKNEVGFDCEVILPATHDTGSAVMSVPASGEDHIYISSGTWSLMGVEQTQPDCSLESMDHNFTNEGGYDYRFRYLKNIMGLWMIQSVKKELNDQYSFAKLCEMAAEKNDFVSLVDVNDAAFLAPKSMIAAIQKYCRETGQQEPVSPAELAACIYQSLAACYGETVKEITAITGRNYSRIHIVGGGSNADYLNQLTADATGLEVIAGPTEATAIGNLLVQMIRLAAVRDLEQARKLVAESFPMKNFN